MGPGTAGPGCRPGREFGPELIVEPLLRCQVLHPADERELEQRGSTHDKHHEEDSTNDLGSGTDR